MPQPQPEKNNHKYVVDEVVKDIEERKRIGKEKYGTPLQPFNGRDCLRDAYEEALDLSIYLKQCLMEWSED